MLWATQLDLEDRTTTEGQAASRPAQLAAEILRPSQPLQDQVLDTELFNIPDWECPEALEAPFYEGL